MQGEVIHLGDHAVRLLLPTSYEREGVRRYPLLLVLESTLDAGAWSEMLHAEGVLPEVIVATMQGKVFNPTDTLLVLSRQLRLLEAPAARWIIGTAHTAVMAMNAVFDHPQIFGKGVFLSTSFEGVEGAPPLHSKILRSLEERSSLPSREGESRLFFDYGTVGLDECYEPYHRDLGGILRDKGWKQGREFEITRAVRGTHDAASWNARLGPALRWLATH